MTKGLFYIVHVWNVNDIKEQFLSFDANSAVSWFLKPLQEAKELL